MTTSNELVGSDRRQGRRLLFIAHSFPPARNIGSVRTGNMVKHLARAGWRVTVVTPDPSLRRHVDTNDAMEAAFRREGVRRLLTGHRWRWLAPGVLKCRNEGVAWVIGGACRRVVRGLGFERTIGWVGPAERACSQLTPGDVDLILASGPPFSGFQLARRLADRLDRPFVVDYRDLWSKNMHHPQPRAVRTEAEILARSAAVTVVSPSWARLLDNHFSIGPRVHVISNGFDAEELTAVEAHEFGHFAIVYAGVFYPPKRVVSPLMSALERLSREATGVPWMFHYYGRHERHVLEEAARLGLHSRVVVHGHVNRAMALSALKGAGVAVVITSSAGRDVPENNGMVTAKIFDVIGVGAPMLLLAPVESDARSVAETAGGARSFAAGDSVGIARFIREVMEGVSLERKDPWTYEWSSIGRQMDELLTRCIR